MWDQRPIRFGNRAADHDVGSVNRSPGFLSQPGLLMLDRFSSLDNPNKSVLVVILLAVVLFWIPVVAVAFILG